MINAKDLRIGNLVMINDRVITMDNRIFHAVIHGFDGYEPEEIPLTKEILEKSGFENGFENSFIVDRFRFIWKQPYEYWYVVGLHDNAYMTKIEFVHELQNFFYAMNNQELNIKL